MARMWAMQRWPASRDKRASERTMPRCLTCTSTSSSFTTKYISLARIRTACSTRTATTCSGSSLRRCKGTVSSHGLVSSCSFSVFSVLVCIRILGLRGESQGLLFVSDDVQDEIHPHHFQQLLAGRSRRMQDQHSAFPGKPLMGREQPFDTGGIDVHSLAQTKQATMLVNAVAKQIRQRIAVLGPAVARDLADHFKAHDRSVVGQELQGHGTHKVSSVYAMGAMLVFLWSTSARSSADCRR